MSSSALAGEHPTGWSYVNWDDLSGLDTIVAAYAVGENSVVVETSEGREIRITVWRDLGSDRYVADFERRTSLSSGGNGYQVWAHTPAYQRCPAENREDCLEAAVLEVDRVHVY
jgi:hypothetical protein